MLTEIQIEKSKKLSKYKWLSKELDSKIKELEKWRLRLRSVNVKYTDMPKSSFKTDKIGEGVASVVDIESELEKDISKLVQERDSIYFKINEVKNEQLKHVLRQRYIDSMTFEEMAVDNGKSWRHIHRLHEKALDEINI